MSAADMGYEAARERLAEEGDARETKKDRYGFDHPDQDAVQLTRDSFLVLFYRYRPGASGANDNDPPTEEERKVGVCVCLLSHIMDPA
jgi:hypothetical protein